MKALFWFMIGIVCTVLYMEPALLADFLSSLSSSVRGEIDNVDIDKIIPSK